MINCAHPTHFDALVRTGEPWLARLGGYVGQRLDAEPRRARRSDRARPWRDPDDLARRYADLRSHLPALHVVGGCCGTDHRHVAAIVDAVTTDKKVPR